jgi:signal transduction histidine kinase
MVILAVLRGIVLEEDLVGTEATMFGRRAGLVLATSASGIFVVTLVAALLSELPASERFDQAALGFGASLLGTTAAILASKRPRNALLWILAVAGVGVTLSGAALLAVDPPENRLDGTVLYVQGALFFGGLALFVCFFPLLFPDGKLPGRRWRILAWIAGVATVGAVLWAALSPVDAYGEAHTPFGAIGEESPLNVLLGLVFVPFLMALTGGLLAMIVRYRRGDTELRRRMRVPFFAVLLWLPFFIVINMVFEASLGQVVGQLVNVALPVLLAASLVVAVTRYRLYEIDVFINKTIVYGSLVAFISGVFGLVVFVPFLVVGAGEGTTAGELVLPLVATVVLVVAFQPVRARLQRAANRLVYGERATPYEALSDFSSTVAESPADEELLGRMAEILADGTGAAEARVWVVAGPELRLAAAHPASNGDTNGIELVDGDTLEIPGADSVAEVTHRGELLGALSVVSKPGESLRPIEERLMADLASHAGVVLRNFRLTDELLRRLDELRASRQRLVAAQDEERRRLERNLHDGAQQQLVALKIKLGMLRMVEDQEKRATLVDALSAETDDAIDSLRDLARGIYPPTLAQEGLVSALRAQASKAVVPTRVEADGIERYSPDVEAAVYFCTLEALQNIAKYAEASEAWVRLAARKGSLRFEVTDDGKGFDALTTKRGAGLQNMEDRLEALGGSVEIASAPGRGTTVAGLVPAIAKPVTSSS